MMTLQIQCMAIYQLNRRLCKMEDLTTAISMFGYTVIFGIIGIVLYTMFKNNSKNRRKGDK